MNIILVPTYTQDTCLSNCSGDVLMQMPIAKDSVHFKRMEIPV